MASWLSTIGSPGCNLTFRSGAEPVMCASRWVAQATKPPLNSIPVSGPFDLVGVGVIKFPKSQKETNML